MLFDTLINSEKISSFFYKIGFDYSKIKSHPVNNFKVHVLDEEPLLVKNKEPFFYLVKRGVENNDFDSKLEIRLSGNIDLNILSKIENFE